MQHKIKYFDRFYDNNDDPWGYQSHWYEERKRQICLAMLLKSQYSRVLEIGCANGCFSKKLAQRAQYLLCLDGHPKAVELTKNALQHLKHVDIECRVLPQEFPSQRFDLIVLSEIAYYLSTDELSLLTEKLSEQLSQHGMLLSCHWRHPVADFELDGNQVHHLLKSQLKLHHYASLTDPDFLIDLWTKETQSLAEQEGIV